MSENTLSAFTDIISDRRILDDDLCYMSRAWKPMVAYKQTNYLTPDELKLHVIKSDRIKLIIDELSTNQAKRKELLHDVKQMLDEIGLCRRMTVLRWLGVILTKITKKVCEGIYVNKNGIAMTKQAMGNNPILFLPSHRSYADFILMSFVCFYQDIDIPAIAAGMDFHSMWGMGTILRQTCAFFMRRSFGNDEFYWSVFKEYIRTLVTRNHTAMEFFIEGTRSRSCKALMPKIGLLSMALEPFFVGEVPDVTIVPINLSYERVMEECLFARELLGIPKPKESTKGLLKSLQIIKQRYGKIHIEFSKPISAKEYFENRLDRSVHSNIPKHLQKLSPNEIKLTNDLAHEVIKQQQNSSVFSTFNLMSVMIYYHLYKKKIDLPVEDLLSEIEWLKDVLSECGGRTSCSNLYSDMSDALNVHHNLVVVEDDKVKLLHNEISMLQFDTTKLKGHCLADRTMTRAIPMMQLQLYINPTLYCLVGPAIIIMAIRVHMDRGYPSISQTDLQLQSSQLRDIFSHEFVLYKPREATDFQLWMHQLKNLCAINVDSFGQVSLGSNEKLIGLLIALMAPFVKCYLYICRILFALKEKIPEKQLLIEIQKSIEVEMKHCDYNSILYYSLSLDSITIALQALCALGSITKERRDNVTIYQPNSDEIRDQLTILESCHLLFRVNYSKVQDKLTLYQTSSKL